jgi:pyruvate kinase
LRGSALIATLPAAHQAPLLRQILEHPEIAGARYNVGARSPWTPRETLERVAAIARGAGKTLWVDLKGRQLRIEQWAVPTYGDIVLNHEIEVDLPARIVFRGGEAATIVEVVGRRVYVDPPPPAAVGQGQAVNVHGTNLVVRGYLTEEDEEYLEACRTLDIADVMLSFVEEARDVLDVRALLPDARPVLKIESPKGLALVATAGRPGLEGCRLMAARDDLMVNIGENTAEMLPALEALVRADPEAILASRLFLGVERTGAAALADFCDLRLMEGFGYRAFMLSDGISLRHFPEAMRAWRDYRAVTDRAADARG